MALNLSVRPWSSRVGGTKTQKCQIWCKHCFKFIYKISFDIFNIQLKYSFHFKYSIPLNPLLVAVYLSASHQLIMVWIQWGVVKRLECRPGGCSHNFYHYSGRYFYLDSGLSVGLSGIGLSDIDFSCMSPHVQRGVHWRLLRIQIRHSVGLANY